ncbi:MAG: Omp28-related outer membrane protein [Saprospiraceae bacterium]|nr:Omp28-related outer membrane protein [Saprospiraceae bacterium]
MKSFYRLTVLLIICWNSASAQKTSPHLPVAVKITATWCNVCGLSSWDSFKEMVEEYEDKVVIMAVHADEGSQLNSLAASLYAANLPDRFGQPQFYINEQSIGIADDWRWKGALENAISQFRASTPLAASEVAYSIKDDMLEVTSVITFNRGTNRAIHQALYLVEDHVSAFQNNRRPEDLHRKILRTHISESPMGDLISNTEITSGQSFTQSYSLPIDSSWKSENLEIASILFEKVGERYVFHNGSTALSPVQVTSTADQYLDDANMIVSPSPLLDHGKVMLQLDRPLADATLHILDSGGRLVQELFRGTLEKGQHTFDIPRGGWSSGLYLLELRQGSKKTTVKFIVR